MGFSNIQYRVEDGVGILTVDRPKALNALNKETIKEICSVLAEAKESKTVRVLIVTGSGEKAFIAGADINEINDLGLKDALDCLSAGNRMNFEIET